jgi:predicted nuclease of restriction endonuclease-like (RecB) superfamily
LAADLKARGLKGLGISMLKNCRQFYRLYPDIRQSLAGELGTIPVRPEIGQSTIGEFDPGLPALPPEHLLRLSWTHFIELIRIDDPLKRAFYEVQCLQGNWSIHQLQRQIGSLLYERTGLSTDKESVIGRAASQDLPPSITTLPRDPYVLEFAGLAERPSYSEADLESALLDHLQAFLLELGTGFCFEARQKRITIGNEHDYIDLVFSSFPSLPLTGGSQDPAVQPSGRRANEFLPELFQAEDDGHGGQSSRRRHPLQRQRSNEGSIRDRRPG